MHRFNIRRFPEERTRLPVRPSVATSVATVRESNEMNNLFAVSLQEEFLWSEGSRMWKN